jgi:site-specific recombinase XerD
MAFVEFRRWAWPKDSAQLLRVSILDVQAFKDYMVRHNAAPKTMNRRISSLSSFYRYLAGAAAELRLPITVPNPAHAQFIARDSSDPVDETRALSETRARQLVAMPAGDSLLDLRDRAILKFYLYTGARIETGCRLKVPDFHQDGDEATLRFHIKGGHVKTKGIHFSAAESIAEYIKAAGIESGPLFRPRRSRHSADLAPRRMTDRSMYRLLMSYLDRLPGAMREKELPDGEKIQECIYSPPLCGRQRRRCCWMRAWRLNPSRICSTKTTSRPRRFMISGGAPCAAPPPTRCRFRGHPKWGLFAFPDHFEIPHALGVALVFTRNVDLI